MCITVQIRALLEVRVTYVSTCWQASLCPWAVRAAGEVDWSGVPRGRMWSWWRPASLCARSAALLAVRAPCVPLGPALTGTTLYVSGHHPSRTVVLTHSPPPTAQTDTGLVSRWDMRERKKQIYKRTVSIQLACALTLATCRWLSNHSSTACLYLLQKSNPLASSPGVRSSHCWISSSSDISCSERSIAFIASTSRPNTPM